MKPYLSLPQVPSLNSLDQLVREATLQGLAYSSAKKYAYAQRSYAVFCSSLGVNPLPCSKNTVLRFVVWLKDYKKKLSSSAIHSHLAAPRNLHIIDNFSLEIFSDPQLGLVKRSACKRDKPRDSRVPVGYTALSSLFNATPAPYIYDDLLFLTAALLIYSGFLRVSEAVGKPFYPNQAGLRLRHLSVVDGALKLTLEESV